MTEEVLIKVELPNAEENNKHIDDLTRDIIGLSDANKELAKTNEALAKVGQKNTQEYVNNAKQIEINKQKISENTASRKGLIQTIQAEDNSIKGLRVQNAELIKQRDQINTKTKEGQAAIAKINAKLDENNIAIKTNVSALEKQKINIGNYASALDGVIPGIGGVTSGLSAMLNPATAAATAIGTLTTLFFQSGRGAQELEQIEFRLAATKTVLANRVADLVDGFRNLGEPSSGALAKFAKGLIDTNPLVLSFRYSMDLLNRAFSGTESAQQIETLTKINAELDDLNQATTIAQTTQQNLLEDNADLMEQMNREATAFNDKQFLAGQAIDNIRNGEKAILDIKIRELELLNQQLEIDKDSEATQRAIAAKELEIAQERRRAEKLVNNIQKALDNLQTTESKRLETLSKIEQKEALILKHKEAQIKLSGEVVDEAAIRNSVITGNEEITSSLLNMTLQTDALSKAIDNKVKANEKDIKASQVGKQSDDLRTKSLLILSNALGGVATLFGENTIASKIFSSAQAAINSYLAGTEVLAEKNPFKGPGARIAGMIAVITAGLAQQARILGAFAFGGILKKFAVGGIADSGGVLSGPSHARGGIPFSVGGRLGFEAEGGEAIINKRSTAMFRGELSRINQAGGGRSLMALGGIASNETRIATQQAQSQFDLNQMASLMNMVQVVLVREDFEVKQMEHTETISRAKVI